MASRPILVPLSPPLRKTRILLASTEHINPLPMPGSPRARSWQVPKSASEQTRALRHEAASRSAVCRFHSTFSRPLLRPPRCAHQPPAAVEPTVRATAHCSLEAAWPGLQPLACCMLHALCCSPAARCCGKGGAGDRAASACGRAAGTCPGSCSATACRALGATPVFCNSVLDPERVWQASESLTGDLLHLQTLEA